MIWKWSLFVLEKKVMVCICGDLLVKHKENYKRSMKMYKAILTKGKL